MSDKEAPEIKYDVFISFRGEDTRRGILSYLVANLKRENIEVFVDYRLKIGDEIGQSLVEAIEGSFILLIIFSPNYASSAWCLGELVKIVECKGKYGRNVFPIFYDVEPTHVRHQSSEKYKEAFAEHEKEKDDAKVQLWRRALNESATIKGHESSKFQDDAELVEKIVSDVNIELKRLATSPVNSKGLVAIDEKIADMESLIRKEPNNTRLIGIWGMGGIGKTTLAKQVFNKLRFEYAGSYFLADEKDQSAKDGIIPLKKKLFSKLLDSAVEIDTDDLPEDIVRKIGRMKVLIVLDNVNDPVHIQKLLGDLKNFRPGSRIIVTTRYEQVLKTNYASETYPLAILSFNEALELFNLKAFNQSDLQREYTELSKRAVHYAKGIPLVLEVLASHLCGNNKDQWESELDKLEKMPHRQVYDQMIWSYEDLDHKQKQIFLDLACFFVTSHHAINKGDLESLLKDSERDNSVFANIGILKNKSLITISEDNVVSIHDSLQEMAREIVRQESIEDPGSRSRLWDPDDIYKALKTGKVTEAIRSIQIQLPTIEERELISHIIPKMNSLEFLEIHGKYLDDDCLDQLHILAESLQFLSTELKFLYWDHYPLKSMPEKFPAERLVILSLRYGEMEKLWDGVKNLVNLKEVNLSRSYMLKELPDLSKATSLEVLDVRYCKKLQILPELPQSLKTLQAASCSSLETLPDLLPYLEVLDVRHCKKLHILPELPQSLKTLQATSCSSLETLPDLPPHLEVLKIGFCTKLHILPELPQSLKTLQAASCNSLETLPDLPPYLEVLVIRFYKKLHILPKLPQSLKTLYATSCTSLETLPDLSPHLEVLDVGHCKKLHILSELPQSLKTLQAASCNSLETLPDLPPYLEVLVIRFCEKLHILPKLPQSLKTLYATSCTSLETLPDLPLYLEVLDVKSCEKLCILPELPQSLKTLEAAYCTSLETLPDLLPHLEVLDVRDCKKLHILPKLPQSLQILKVTSYTSLETLPDLPLYLEVLDVRSCEKLCILPKLPQSLKTLYATSCTSLETLPDLPSCLEVLDVKYCEKLHILPKFPQSLKTLKASFCTSLEILPDLPPYLKVLDVGSCNKLHILPKLPQSLKTLHANSFTSLETLPDLPPHLEFLNVINCKKLHILPKLPQSLKTLYATFCTSLETLSDLPPHLKVLDVRDCRKLQTLSKLPKSLKSLKANNCLNLDEDSLVAIRSRVCDVQPKMF